MGTDGCTTVTPIGLAHVCSWCGEMTEAEAMAEAARLTATSGKGVKFTAQQICRGWAVERRVATEYFAFDRYIHEAGNGADHDQQAGN